MADEINTLEDRAAVTGTAPGAEETTGSLAVYKDGKIVQEKIGKGASR